MHCVAVLNKTAQQKFFASEELNSDFCSDFYELDEMDAGCSEHRN